MQCIVKPPAKLTVFGKCHISLSENDKERIMNTNTEATNEEETEAVEEQAVVDTIVEDSEDEEEPEPEPKPEPVKKKRVVKKKAST